MIVQSFVSQSGVASVSVRMPFAFNGVTRIEMTWQKDRFAQIPGAVETRVFLGEDAHALPEELQSYGQRM